MSGRIPPAPSGPWIRRVAPAAALTLLLALVGWPRPAGAQYSEVPPPAAYALQNVTVVGADGSRFSGGLTGFSLTDADEATVYVDGEVRGVERLPRGDRIRRCDPP